VQINPITNVRINKNISMKSQSIPVNNICFHILV
jgi:hypothetical protein